MLHSVIHHACEVSIYTISEDIFIHPPPPNSEFPGNDQTCRGVVEIKSPSDRVIPGLKVQFQAIQTLAIPEAQPGPNGSGLRWEEKILVDKSVEVLSDGQGGLVKHTKGKGKLKVREKHHGHGHAPHSQPSSSNEISQPGTSSKPSPEDTPGPPLESALAATSLDDIAVEEGIHLTKGVQGYEFAFTVPATSPPFERSRHGRVKYMITATAYGAGRAKANVVAHREIFVILNVHKDGGPTPLEITYADVHEALGPISISLTSASLTVGGTALLTVVHADPPPKLNVHVIRVFCEQTFEMYSEVRKAWLKLPTEKLRIAEWGHMPNKPLRSVYAHTEPADTLWVADPNGGEGKPGKGAFHGIPHVAAYGKALAHPSVGTSGTTTPAHPLSSSPAQPFATLPGAPALAGSPVSPARPIPVRAGSSAYTGAKKGYKIKSTVRLPNDDQMRPSTVRGSRAEIRIGHEMGVEVFFSREDLLDTREGSESFGKPKVQVFSARRAVVVPSCTATFDTVHLPPYVQESPASSRPPSPLQLARSPTTQQSFIGGHSQSANHSHTDLQKLANTLHNTLPGGRGRPTPPSSKPTSNPGSNPGSRMASREPSPTRPGISRNHSHSSSLGLHGLGHGLHMAFSGRKSRPGSRPNSRPSSPTHDKPDPIASSSPSASHHTPSHPIRTRRGFGNNNLHALTPAISTQTITAPASGMGTPLHGPASSAHHIPRTLAPNAPWALTSLPPRTGGSHDTCNCGRTTEELAAAEARLIDGVPTAPGAFSEHHAAGEEPPPWSQSRAPSPDYFSQVWANTQSAVGTPAPRTGKTPYGSPH